MRYLHNNRAFTLVESLIAIAILSLVVLSFILAYTAGRYGTILAKERIVVSNLLKSEMEGVFTNTYEAISPYVVNISVNDGSKTLNITKTLKVDTIDPATYGYKKVYIKLSWTGGASGGMLLKEEAIAYVSK